MLYETGGYIMVKEKYRYWIIGIVIAFALHFIGGIFAGTPENPNRKTITVNAPTQMQPAFTRTLEKLKMDGDYTIEFTTNKALADFVVSEGKNAEGELIAYSPFIALFNWDSDLKNQYVEQGIFVESQISSEEYDFDFKKVIEEIVSSTGSDFKVYYPAKNTNYWDEFYAFLLFTVNDGYYPKNDTDLQKAEEIIEKFLTSKNAEPIDNNNLKRLSGINQHTIYFMTYVDLAELTKNTGLNNYRIMYPKAVVYHNYYASFNENGKILFDIMYEAKAGILESYDHVGYGMLKGQYYNTPYTSGTYRCYNSDYSTGVRSTYNGVEIPEDVVITTTNKEDAR